MSGWSLIEVPGGIDVNKLPPLDVLEGLSETEILSGLEHSGCTSNKLLRVRLARLILKHFEGKPVQGAPGVEEDAGRTGVTQDPVLPAAALASPREVPGVASAGSFGTSSEGQALKQEVAQLRSALRQAQTRLDKQEAVIQRFEAMEQQMHVVINSYANLRKGIRDLKK